MAETVAAEGGTNGDQKIPPGYVPETEIAGLKAKNRELLDELKKVKAKMPDPEEVESLRQSKAEAERAEAERRGKFEEVKAQLQSEADRKIKAERERADKLRQSLASRAVREEALAAMAKARVLPEFQELVMLEIERWSEAVVDEDEASAVVRVKDPVKGHRTAKHGDYMTLAEFVEGELTAKYPKAFEGQQKAGSGATGHSGSARGMSDLTDPRAMIEHGLSGGRS